MICVMLGFAALSPTYGSFNQRAPFAMGTGLAGDQVEVGGLQLFSHRAAATQGWGRMVRTHKSRETAFIVNRIHFHWS